jgi:hypothetical protein
VPSARLELTGEWVAMIVIDTLVAGLVVSLKAFLGAYCCARVRKLDRCHGPPANRLEFPRWKLSRVKDPING